MRPTVRLMTIILSLGAASCSLAPQALIRNASGADLVLWPLSERPTPLKSGATSAPLVLVAHEEKVAMIERGNCLYTYPAPRYFELPKALREHKKYTAVIQPDMSLAIHLRNKDDVEGQEIVVAGFPLKPTTFCGRRG